MLARLEAPLDALLSKLQETASERPQLTTLDGVMAVVAALFAALVAAWAASQVGDVPYTEGSFGIWFQADNPRVLANLFDASSNQYRANVHPIFPILLTPWVSLLPGLGGSPIFWGKAVVVVCAAGSAAALFIALRLMILPRAVALVFIGVFVSSAGYLHWYSVIESAPFNGLSTCLAVLALTYGPSRRRLWWVLMSGFTMGMTITNWSAGLAATLARWRLRPAISMSLMALTLVGVLAVGQRLVYPTAGVFFNPRGLMRESAYTAAETPHWSPAENLRSLVLYTMVSPPPVLEKQVNLVVVTNQRQGFSSFGVAGGVALAAWVMVLAGGTFAAATTKHLRPVAFGLALMLLAQGALSAVYGEVTFLYATNILPMLVILAAFTWFLPARRIALALSAVLVVSGAINNAATLSRSVTLAQAVLMTGGNPVWSRYSAAGGFVLPMPASKPAP